MSANTLNATTYTNVANNTVNDAVIDAASILSWRQDVKSVVDQHATEINGKLGSLATTDLDMEGHNVSDVGFLNMRNQTTLTISSGAITVTQGYHWIDTEGGSATDDLATINGGNVGDLLLLRQTNSSRDITIKGDGSGNISSFDGSDVVFVQAASAVMLFKYSSSAWLVLGIQGVKRTGDTMTGDLVFSGARAIVQAVATEQIQLSGGTASNLGANLILYGQSAGSGLSNMTRIRSGSTNNWSIDSAGIITLRNGTTHGEVTGTPEGVVTAPVGSTRYRTDGAATTTLYVKTSGVGNVGWTAK